MKLKPANCAIVFFASVFQAFGMYHVHAQSAVTEGGVFGMTLLLEHWFHISPAITNFLLTGACFLLGWKTLGRNFIGYSAVAVAAYSLGYGLFEQFPPLWPQLAEMPLTASVVGALFIGIGAGLCVRAGGATSGDDALAMSIRAITGMGVEKVYLISDLTVLLLSLSYIPLTRILYSLLTVVLSGQIVGWIQHLPTTRQKAAS